MNSTAWDRLGSKQNRRQAAPDSNVTFYVWIDGMLRHQLPAPDIATAITWADEQYPYARQREIYRSWHLERQS